MQSEQTETEVSAMAGNACPQCGAPTHTTQVEHDRFWNPMCGYIYGTVRETGERVMCEAELDGDGYCPVHGNPNDDPGDLGLTDFYGYPAG